MNSSKTPVADAVSAYRKMRAEMRDPDGWSSSGWWGVNASEIRDAGAETAKVPYGVVVRRWAHVVVRAAQASHPEDGRVDVLRAALNDAPFVASVKTTYRLGGPFAAFDMAVEFFRRMSERG